MIYKALFTSADVSVYSETQPKTPNSKHCGCRGMVARKTALESHEPRKKPREDPCSEGVASPVLAVQVEIIYMVINKARLFFKMFKCS